MVIKITLADTSTRVIKNEGGKMFNIDYIPTEEELHMMCYSYKLPILLEKDLKISNLQEAATYSFDKCIRFFPEDFIKKIEEEKKFDEFKKGIIEHLIFITTMRIEYRNLLDKYVEESNKRKNKSIFDTYFSSFRKFIEHFEQYSNIFMPDKLYDVSSYSRKKKDFFNESRCKKDLYIFSPNNNNHILKWQYNYLLVSLHEIKRSTNNKQRIGNKLQYRYLRKFITDFQGYIEKLGEYNKALAFYLIERDYNFILIKSITTAFISNRLEPTEYIVQALALLCLFPNAYSRKDYPDIFIKLLNSYMKNKSLNIYDDEYKAYKIKSFIYKEEDFIEEVIDHISNMIIQMFSFNIPLLEYYTYYVIKYCIPEKSINVSFDLLSDKIKKETVNEFKNKKAFRQIANTVYEFNEIDMYNNTPKVHDICIDDEQYLKFYKEFLMQSSIEKKDIFCTIIKQK